MKTKRKIVWVVVSGLMVLALLAAACAPAVEEVAPPGEKPAAPAEVVAPAEKPAAPTGPEMVKVSLKKLDGTVVEKMVEKPRYGGQLVVGSDNPVVGWDEAFTQIAFTHRYTSPNYDKLLQGDWARGPAGTGETTWALAGLLLPDYAVGALAESWEVVDSDTLIYHIRQGVHFGLNLALEASRLVGGREITADDIVWQLKRVFWEYKTSGAYAEASTVADPADIYATDKWTVVLKIKPGQFWNTFMYAGLYVAEGYAPEVAKKWGDGNDWKRVVGTGPFILKDYVAMNQATWVRNPNYWMKDPLFPENQLPYIDTLKVLIIPDESTRMSALRTGKVDLDYSEATWEDKDSLLKTTPHLKYLTLPGGVDYMAFRQDKPELPYDDINVRRALAMAINYQEWGNTYYGGNFYPFAGPLVPNKEYEKAFTPPEKLGLAPDGFDTRRTREYHPEEAKKLLAEAGYPKGFKAEIVANPKQVDGLSIVKAYWEKIGVDLKIDVKEETIWYNMRNKHTYKEGVAAGFNYAANFYKLSRWRPGVGGNTAVITDPKWDEWYEQLGVLRPWSDEWLQVCKEANLWDIHQVYYIYWPVTYDYVFWQPWLKGYQGERTTEGYQYHFSKYIWIDQELKKAMGR